MVTHPFMAGLGAVIAAALLGAYGCGGSTRGGPGTTGARPGQQCALEGQRTFASDGCNTCTCSNGTWACTATVCACEPGTTTSDGCNTCTCTDDRQLACTDRACPPAECPAPVPTSSACPAVIVYAKDPATGLCCEYGDACRVPPGMTVYATLALCQGTTMCVPGRIDLVAGGCCVCDSMGSLVCMTRDECPDGGRGSVQCGGQFGSTCTDAEYCAYVAGEMCGATGATSVCLPRASACPENYDPVCGCDGQTHSNACAASMDGTGVYSSGPCGTPL